MTKVIAIAALAGLASTAAADTFSLAGPMAPNGTRGGGSTYQIDDGNSENSLGLTSGGYLVATNQFTVTGGNNIITSIEVTWGTDEFAGQNGVVPNAPFDVYIWQQNSASTDPTTPNATLLFTTAGTISPGSIDNNVFQTIAIPNIAIPTGGFFIGIGHNHAAGTFPFSLDESVGALGRSWALGGAGWNPNTPLFGGGPALDIAALGFGNFMIRANAVPAPGAAALLAIGGLVAGRRRR